MQMNAIYLFFISLIIGLKNCNCFSYDKVGESFYFIASGHSEDHYFDYFDARRTCWHNDGELVSVETAEEMLQLQNYIVSKDYANGSIFATSGYSYNSEYPFKWEALDESVTYRKWLPGEAPPPDCNLSLQLIDSELYMIRTWGYNRYFICEKTTIWQYFQASLRQYGLRILSISIWSSLCLLPLINFIRRLLRHRLQYQCVKLGEKNKVDFV